MVEKAVSVFEDGSVSELSSGPLFLLVSLFLLLQALLSHSPPPPPPPPPPVKSEQPTFDAALQYNASFLAVPSYHAKPSLNNISLQRKLQL